MATDVTDEVERSARVRRIVGAALVIVAVGMLGIVVGGWFQRARMDDLNAQLDAQRSRVGQLEDELDAHGIEIPAPTIIVQAPPAATTTTTARRAAPLPSPTSTTSTTSSTTTTSQPPEPPPPNEGGVCLGPIRIGACP